MKIELHPRSGREHIVCHLIVIFETDRVPHFDGDFSLRKVTVLLGNLVVCPKQWECAEDGKTEC